MHASADFETAERNADLGEAAVAAGTADGEHNDTATNVADALANIAHFCDRAGLDFDERVAQALHYYEGELAEGMTPAARRDA